MKLVTRYFGDLFLNKLFFVGLAVMVSLFVIAYFIPWVEVIAAILLSIFIFLCLADYTLLFFTRSRIIAERVTSGRISNGDENKVELLLTNEFSLPLTIKVIDELPIQFQERNWRKQFRIAQFSSKKIMYYLRPLSRGEYHFGNIVCFASSMLHLLNRRFTSAAEEMVEVYPSFLQMYKYQIMSNAVIQQNGGNSRMRKLGQSMEFEQIKEYVTGDDIRTLNWKASARRGGLMINNFMEERSQQVYCIIDKGRLMRMPFDGLTLLDYAINSALVLSSVCLTKQDKIGLITFSNTLGTVLAADRRPQQRDHIMRVLYNQQTDFLESDFEMLYMEVRHRIRHRSFLVLFTNFESMSGLQRQLDYLRAIASHHLLLVIFFENTELNKFTGTPAENVEDVYIKTIAEKFSFEKRLIAKELSKYGILSVLTAPHQLTIHSINKYLELKARQAI